VKYSYNRITLLWHQRSIYFMVLGGGGWTPLVTESSVTVDAVVQTEPVMVLPVPLVCYHAASQTDNSETYDRRVNTENRRTYWPTTLNSDELVRFVRSRPSLTFDRLNAEMKERWPELIAEEVLFVRSAMLGVA
jgi:hypothetical protein